MTNDTPTVQQVRDALREQGDYMAQHGLTGSGMLLHGLAAQLEGCQIVPGVPTKAMCEAGGRAFLEGRDTTATTEQQDAANIYRAMLAVRG